MSDREQLLFEIAELDAKLTAEREARMKAEANFTEEKEIVNRIWKQLGSPTYEELKGRTIYDLIDSLRERAERAESACAEMRRELEEIRSWAITEKTPLRTPEIASITKVLARTTIGQHMLDVVKAADELRDSLADCVEIESESADIDLRGLRRLCAALAAYDRLRKGER